MAAKYFDAVRGIRVVQMLEEIAEFEWPREAARLTDDDLLAAFEAHVARGGSNLSRLSMWLRTELAGRLARGAQGAGD